MSSIRNSLAAGLLAAAAALVGAAPAEAAACSRGICAESVTNGPYVHVRYWVQNGPVSHVNIRSANFIVRNCQGICPDPFQREGGARGSFVLQSFRGTATRYSIQVCVRGGFLQRSSCGGWAAFRHG
jgi:hypothetical protein